MYLILERDEHRCLAELVESRIRELHPEIRRCQCHEFRDELKQQLQVFQRVLQRLHEAEFDVSA